MSDGYYNVPAGTYISPNNAVSNSYGGSSITVDFSGAVFNNTSRQEMDAWAETTLVPALVDVLHDERRGQVR